VFIYKVIYNFIFHILIGIIIYCIYSFYPSGGRRETLRFSNHSCSATILVHMNNEFIGEGKERGALFIT
jgi:hypothetical protein